MNLAADEELVAYPGVPIPLRVTGTFSLAPTATFDLTDNAAIVDPTSNSAAVVREKILSGRGGPGLGKGWNGTGITSSTAAWANQSEPESRSIGYAENAALPLGALSEFHGVEVGDNSILIACTRTADANLDGIVNNDDVTIVGANYAPGVSKPSWALGDFDYNGFVDNDDVTLLGAFYNPSAVPLGPPPPVATSNAIAVPEPASFALLIIGLPLLALRMSARFGTGKSIACGLLRSTRKNETSLSRS
jgi:hypothetical protein